MRTSDTTVSLLLVLALAALTCDGAGKQSLLVRAVSHREQQVTSTSPGVNRTTCSPNGNDVECLGTSTPATTRVTAIRVTEVVQGNGQIYTISCSKWAFGGYSCASLVDSQDFQAEIEGNSMWILASKNGNQGKTVRIKFQILDVRQTPPQEAKSPGAAATPSELRIDERSRLSEPPPVNYAPPVHPKEEVALKNEDIIRLKSLGFSDDLLIASIRAANKTDFHVTVDDLAGLREKGISEAVLIEMLNAAKREQK